MCISIFRDFQFFLAYIPGPSVCILFFTLFSDFIIFRRWRMFLIFHDFQIFSYIPRPTVDILNFPPFSVFSLYFYVLKCVFLYFPWFSVFSLYSRSFSVHFIFLFFFSDFIIFRRWRMFLFSMIFSFCYIPRPTVDILNFSTFFSVFLVFYISRPKVCIFIFRDFQFSRLYSRSQCAFYIFHVFLVISLFFSSQVDVSFSMIFSFLAYIPRPTVDIFKFSTFFSVFLAYISRPKVCILFSVIFSFSLIFQVLQCAFFIFHAFLVIFHYFSSLADVFIFHDFQFFAIFHVLQWIFFKFSTFFQFSLLYFTS